jgi:hypothetical protein
MNASTSDSYVVFEEEVKRSFHFLEQQYGFHLTQLKQVGFVKTISFESLIVYVSLFYGPPAYEVEMSFGRIGIDDAPEAYSFESGDLVLLSSCTNWVWNSANPNHLIGLISEFSRLLRECGVACLKGDQAVFEEMKARRDSAVKVWHQQERQNSVRKEAESAWSRKDYEATARLYETINSQLTETEIKKLDYAKKQLLKPKDLK